MNSSAISAAQAYANTATRALDTVQPDNTTPAKAGSFTDVLKQTISESIQTTSRAEQAGTAAAAGQTDLIGVVTAVSQAEVAVQTVVTIRDKVVQAYQDILKMPI